MTQEFKGLLRSPEEVLGRELAPYYRSSSGKGFISLEVSFDDLTSRALEKGYEVYQVTSDRSCFVIGRFDDDGPRVGLFILRRQERESVFIDFDDVEDLKRIYIGDGSK